MREWVLTTISPVDGHLTIYRGMQELMVSMAIVLSDNGVKCKLRTVLESDYIEF